MDGTLYILIDSKCSHCIKWKKEVMPKLEKNEKMEKVKRTYIATNLSPIPEDVKILHNINWRPGFVWVPKGMENQPRKCTIFPPSNEPNVENLIDFLMTNGGIKGDESTVVYQFGYDYN